jgi:hypothetical protein
MQINSPNLAYRKERQRTLQTVIQYHQPCVSLTKIAASSIESYYFVTKSVGKYEKGIRCNTASVAHYYPAAFIAGEIK